MCQYFVSYKFFANGKSGIGRLVITLDNLITFQDIENFENSKKIDSGFNEVIVTFYKLLSINGTPVQ